MESEVTKKIIEYIDGTKDFLLENAPSFIQEVVAYGRAKSILILGLCPLVFILSLLICWNSSKNIKVDRYDMAEGSTKYLISCIASGILAFIVFIIFCSAAEPSLMSWFAPKLYILKMISGK